MVDDVFVLVTTEIEPTALSDEIPILKWRWTFHGVVPDVAVRQDGAHFVSFEHRRVPRRTELAIVKNIVEQLAGDARELR